MVCFFLWAAELKFFFLHLFWKKKSFDSCWTCASFLFVPYIVPSHLYTAEIKYRYLLHFLYIWHILNHRKSQAIKSGDQIKYFVVFLFSSLASSLLWIWEKESWTDCNLRTDRSFYDILLSFFFLFYVFNHQLIMPVEHGITVIHTSKNKFSSFFSLRFKQKNTTISPFKFPLSPFTKFSIVHFERNSENKLFVSLIFFVDRWILLSETECLKNMNIRFNQTKNFNSKKYRLIQKNE